METGTDCYTDPSSSLYYCSTSVASLAGVAQPWVTEGRKAIILQASSHFGILSSTASMAAGTLCIFFPNIHLLPLFFRLFTQVYLLIDEGWSSLSNPNLLLSFSTVNRVLYLFIHSANHISPSRTIQNRVHKFFGTSTRSSRFHTYISLSPIPCFKIASSTQRSGPQNSQTHSRGWGFTTQSDH